MQMASAARLWRKTINALVANINGALCQCTVCTTCQHACQPDPTSSLVATTCLDLWYRRVDRNELTSVSSLGLRDHLLTGSTPYTGLLPQPTGESQAEKRAGQCNHSFKASVFQAPVCTRTPIGRSFAHSGKHILDRMLQGCVYASFSPQNLSHFRLRDCSVLHAFESALQVHRVELYVSVWTKWIAGALMNFETWHRRTGCPRRAY